MMAIRARDRPDLSNLTILVVEDEFYLAVEMQDEIERAGGIVIGPCADLPDALEMLAAGGIDHALIDINLGAGPSFDLADALRARKIPFTFLTGYDASAIPARFDDVKRVQKPVNLATLLQTIAHLNASRS